MLKKISGLFAVLTLGIPFSTSAAICPSLSLGSSGVSVTAVQKILYDSYSNFPTPTGYFGSITQAALKQWQKDHNITPTGTVGPQTATAMNICNAVPATTVTVPPVSAPTFVAPSTGSGQIRTLYRGLSGGDVTALQQFLISQNLLAPDSALGYFGALTEAAVQRYQSQKGIASAGTPGTTGYGAVGPRTMATMSIINTTPPATPTAPQTPTTPTPPTIAVYIPPPTTPPSNPTSPTTLSSCIWNNQTVASGSSVTAYQSSSVASGQTCTSQQRTCTNGTLNGTYTNASCSVAATPVSTDTQRKQDLQTLSTALNAYYQKHGTYNVAGAGASGSGGGVVSNDGLPQYKTVIQGLYADGDIASDSGLPSSPSGGGDYYLLYTCDAGQTYALSAKLDNPSAADTAYIQTTCNGLSVNGTYTLYKRNYAVQGTTPNLQQFGFYSDDGPAGAAKNNYTSDTAPFSNLTWIAGWDDATIVQDVGLAKSLHKGVILDVESKFFNEPPAVSNVSLKSDYSAFTGLWTKLQNAGLTSTIKGFYIMDEPYERFVWDAPTNQVLVNGMDTVSRYLHTVDASIPTIAVFNWNHKYALSDLGNYIPANLDWMGFDCYYSGKVNVDHCSEGMLIQHMQALLAAKRPSQKIIIVPDTWWWNASPRGAADDATLASRLAIYQRLARMSPDVVAAYPFLYQNFIDGTGIESLPLTRAATVRWFNEIKQAEGVPSF